MKYIFILAQDGDRSVNDVIYWIQKQSGLSVIRINDSCDILSLNIFIDNHVSYFTVETTDVIVDSREIHSYWYRRGEFKFNPVEANSNNNEKILIKNAFDKFYKDEWNHTVDYLHHLLKQSNIYNIGSFTDNFTNKLINLNIAKKHGFLIPRTIISNNLSEIRSFFKHNSKVITKSIMHPEKQIFLSDSTLNYAQSTNIYTINELEETISENKYFQPTQFQEYIEKDFEVRSFYLNKKMYSMAIFSQGNEKTKIDFRNYDLEKPNRFVPYILPQSISRRSISFMEELGYNTGSFDVIYSNNQYYFLEVNTVGQFGWLSHYCNYYIEKEIANQLIKGYGN